MSSSGPDQAIGWLVAFACFVINFLLSGVARSVGVFYVALINVYGASREEAAKPFSTRISVRCIIGPVVGILGQRFGIRNVTAVGSIIAALGSILCFFAPSVFWITMFWGVVHGIGFGLSNVLHMLAIGPYFEKHKASALGFGFAGDSVGAFTFPVVIELLLSEYDVRGMFLIIGGILLNVFPMALLLRKPPWLKHQNRVKSVRVSKSLQDRNVVYENAGEINRGFDDSEKCLGRERKEGFASRQEICASFQFRTDSKISDKMLATQDNLNSSNILDSINKEDAENNIALFKDLSSASEAVPFNDSTQIGKDNHSKLNEGINVLSEDVRDTHQKSEHDFMYTKEHNYENKKTSSSFVKHAAQDIVDKIRSTSFASQISLDGCCMPTECESKAGDVHVNIFGSVAKGHDILQSDNAGRAISASRIETKEPHNDAIPPIHKSSVMGKNILQTFLRINIDPLFNLISLNFAASCYLFVGLMTVNIDYASDHGISIHESKYFVIGYSIADLLGRLSFGQVLDRKLLGLKTYTLMMMVLSGVVVAAIPISRNYYYIMVCMCTCGFIVGTLPMIFPILITTYMGKDEETIAFGCLNFIEGIIMLLMAPMIGYFRDNLGSYDGVLYILGAFVTLAGGLWLIEPLLLNLQEKMIKKRDVKSSSTNL